jgi:hypothetical protein
VGPGTIAEPGTNGILEKGSMAAGPTPPQQQVTQSAPVSKPIKGETTSPEAVPSGTSGTNLVASTPAAESGSQIEQLDAAIAPLGPPDDSMEEDSEDSHTQEMSGCVMGAADEAAGALGPGQPDVENPKACDSVANACDSVPSESPPKKKATHVES